MSTGDLLIVEGLLLIIGFVLWLLFQQAKGIGGMEKDE